ncbi:MAG: hypothetical protein Kow0069_18240 [Promethearchaeota archaeon]
MEEEELRDEAVRLKCLRAASLTDCYSIAAAKLVGAPLYVKKELEIDRKAQREPFSVEIRFIDDL